MVIRGAKRKAPKEAGTVPGKIAVAKKPAEPSVRLPRPPRAAAVTVTVDPGAGTSYADVLEEAHAKSSIEELGIGPGSIRLKRAATDAIVYEISVVGHHNSGRQEFECFLGRLGVHIASLAPGPVIVMGDSAPTPPRGDREEPMLEERRLLLQNEGSVSTCVAYRGESIVDITWASSDAARRLSDWKVLTGVETLSDHLYVVMKVRFAGRNGPRRWEQPTWPSGGGPPPLRWKWEEWNEDMFEAAAHIVAWASGREQPEDSPVDQVAMALRRDMGDICDASMPRAGPPGGGNAQKRILVDGVWHIPEPGGPFPED